jgi:DNA-binding transcriptional regulator YhcF (GntR family)
MKIEKTIDRESKVSLDVQIYSIFKEKITSGEWPTGIQIPAEDDLCETYDVSKSTVREAIYELVREGYFKRLQGKGTFVTLAAPHHGLIMRTRMTESLILEFLDPFGKDVHIAIECTINWYWIVDGLKEVGYDVRLAHTLGLCMITGAKVKTDRRDAFKLARLLRMGELPEAYIYPKEKRHLRDLLRRRIGLVQQRASNC